MQLDYGLLASEIITEYELPRVTMYQLRCGRIETAPVSSGIDTSLTHTMWLLLYRCDDNKDLSRITEKLAR